jgi:DNA-binding phage protein
MRQVKDLIVEELRSDSNLRLVHLQDAITSFLSGDKRTCLLMFRNIVNATCGFPTLSSATQIPNKSLMRMLSISGNPSSDNLSHIINFLLKQEKIDVNDFRLKRAA